MLRNEAMSVVYLIQRRLRKEVKEDAVIELMEALFSTSL